MIVPRSSLPASLELDVEVASQAPAAGVGIVVLDPDGLGVAAAFAHAGYDVRSGVSGVEVLSLLADRPPAAVVCGPGDLRRLVAATVKTRFPSVRIVYADPRHDVGAAARASAEGAHHAIPWPPTTAELHHAVPVRARPLTAATAAPVAMASSLGPSAPIVSSAFASFDDDPDGSTGALRDASLLASVSSSVRSVAPLMASSSSVADGAVEQPPRTSGGAMMGSVFGASSEAAVSLAVMHVPSSSQAPPTGRFAVDDAEGGGAGGFGERTVEVRAPSMLPSHAWPDAPRASGPAVGAGIGSGIAADDDPITLSIPQGRAVTSQLSAASAPATTPRALAPHELLVRLEEIARRLEKSGARDGAADAQVLRLARDELMRGMRPR